MMKKKFNFHNTYEDRQNKRSKALDEQVSWFGESSSDLTVFLEDALSKDVDRGEDIFEQLINKDKKVWNVFFKGKRYARKDNIKAEVQNDLIEWLNQWGSAKDLLKDVSENAYERIFIEGEY